MRRIIIKNKVLFASFASLFGIFELNEANEAKNERIGISTVHATVAMIDELKWQSQRIDFEKLPVYNAKLDVLDT